MKYKTLQKIFLAAYIASFFLPAAILDVGTGHEGEVNGFTAYYACFMTFFMGWQSAVGFLCNIFLPILTYQFFRNNPKKFWHHFLGCLAIGSCLSWIITLHSDTLLIGYYVWAASITAFCINYIFNDAPLKQHEANADVH